MNLDILYARGYASNFMGTLVRLRISLNSGWDTVEWLTHRLWMIHLDKDQPWRNR